MHLRLYSEAYQFYQLILAWHGCMTCCYCLACVADLADLRPSTILPCVNFPNFLVFFAYTMLQYVYQVQ